MQNDIQSFLDEFRPVPKPSAEPLALARHWLEIYSQPETHYPDADAFQISVRRRNARQNLRRILTKHPEVLAVLRAESSAQSQVSK
jgi:hypothetical protein